MTSRERWTIYPLLFLTLGLAVRSIVAPIVDMPVAKIGELECVRLSCEEIVITDESGTTLVHLGRQSAEAGGGGRIELHDAEGEIELAIGGDEGRGDSDREPPAAGEP